MLGSSMESQRDKGGLLYASNMLLNHIQKEQTSPPKAQMQPPKAQV